MDQSQQHIGRQAGASPQELGIENRQDHAQKRSNRGQNNERNKLLKKVGSSQHNKNDLVLYRSIVRVSYLLTCFWNQALQSNTWDRRKCADKFAIHYESAITGSLALPFPWNYSF